jgi:hypothetical protein
MFNPSRAPASRLAHAIGIRRRDGIGDLLESIR